MIQLIRCGLALVTLLASFSALGAFHLFRIEQIYSNADGSVQFIVLHETTGTNGESFWNGNRLAVMRGGQTIKSFTFPNDLPSTATAGKRVLVGTQGFAALNLVAPNYIVPNGFLPIDGATLDYADVNFVTYTSLPTDGVNAITNTGAIVTNMATNFAGMSASVTPAALPPAAPNYEGLWYNAPAESESGWGINLAHQGDVIFLTWFTYDVNGKAWWLTMTAPKTADKIYSGTMVETHGPAFNAVPFNPMTVTPNAVGTGKLTFTDTNNGTFEYTVNGTHQTKNIVRQMFGPVPTCVWNSPTPLTAATNFQDLWYAAPAESESGWGVNFTHQGDNIFATWFTYDFDGNPLWLSVTAAKTAPGVYSGPLVRTTGPAFSAMPFNPAMVMRTGAGSLTITFANGNSASYMYTVSLAGANSVTQTKQIVRQVFAVPGTICQ